MKRTLLLFLVLIIISSSIFSFSSCSEKYEYTHKNADETETQINQLTNNEAAEKIIKDIFVWEEQDVIEFNNYSNEYNITIEQNEDITTIMNKIKSFLFYRFQYSLTFDCFENFFNNNLGILLNIVNNSNKDLKIINLDIQDYEDNTLEYSVVIIGSEYQTTLNGLITLEQEDNNWLATDLQILTINYSYIG